MLSFMYKSAVCGTIISLASLAIQIVDSCKPQIAICALFSIIGFWFTIKSIPNLREKFIAAKVTGVDQAKKSPKPIPESMGVVAGSVFVVMMFLFLPMPFLTIKQSTISLGMSDKAVQLPLPALTLDKIFNSDEFTAIIASLLCISACCCWVLLMMY